MKYLPTPTRIPASRPGNGGNGMTRRYDPSIAAPVDHTGPMSAGPMRPDVSRMSAGEPLALGLDERVLKGPDVLAGDELTDR
jgi:hypothetical protein